MPRWKPARESRGDLDRADPNAAALAGCSPPHDFTPTTGDPARSRCSKCGGEIGTEAARWYEAGLAEPRPQLGEHRPRCPKVDGGRGA